MKTTPFYAQSELVINGTEVRRGDLVAEVTPAAGIPLERAVAAIVNGHVTPTKIEPPAAVAAKAAKPAVPAAESK